MHSKLFTQLIILYSLFWYWSYLFLLLFLFMCVFFVLCSHSCNESFPETERNSKHNCRLCGLLFCTKCTVRHHVPDKYKLKNRPGAARVCIADRQACMYFHLLFFFFGLIIICFGIEMFYFIDFDNFFVFIFICILLNALFI